MHILLTNVHLDCRGRIPVTGMLAGMNLSKPGMNLSKPGMNLSKPGKKHHNHVIITSPSSELIHGSKRRTWVPKTDNYANA